MDNNNRCMNIGQGAFYDLFGWLRAASYAGNSSVNGQACDLWALTSPHANLSACTVGNTPLQLTYHLSTYPTFQQFTYWTFVPGLPDPSYFAMPESCFVPPTLCSKG